MPQSHEKADKFRVVPDGSPIRSLGAVEILRHVPKFNRTVTSNDDTTSVVQNDGDEAESEESAPMRKEAGKGLKRLMRVKNAKKEA